MDLNTNQKNLNQAQLNTGIIGYTSHAEQYLKKNPKLDNTI